ncbi:hypothetical protein P378_10585 [Desulforamulus profundi]|uniref:Uncharacterized protein n=1 Tax=Desulforamulus profundi TaxID=1383067 RepID=A0A2C6LIF3_9FIRM|nr:hypothetical protein P378_10585 [Desulforamulus profundi]
MEIHAIKKRLHNDKIILGYGHLMEKKIKEGIGN